ncbi:MAG TPA: glycosyltransferase family 39 protein [Chloroflexia bacterium]|nr:glycosyltransferase family 39 protein [Chloroflexia bacterium]
MSKLSRAASAPAPTASAQASTKPASPPEAERTSDFLRDVVVWAAVLLALAIRIGYNLALHPDGHPPAQFVIDEREYFGAAHVLAEGRGFTFFDTALWVRPPLFVAALAALYRLFGTGYLPVLVFQSLAGAAVVLALAYLAYRVRGTGAARWTAFIAALYLPLTLFAGLLLSETLFVLLFACALVALYEVARSAPGNPRRGHLWAMAAGLSLGLCILTRGTALAFVPPAAVWLYLVLRREGRAAYAAPALVVGVAVLALVPWTLRNYAAYGRVIAVDTTGGYNLWLAAQGVRDEPRMQAELEGIDGPVAKQDYSYERAFGIIAGDPGAFLAKGLKESLDLWRPSFGAEERQVRGYTLGRVPDWHLGALLVFDDLLYVAIVLPALGGLLFLPAHRLKSLTVLWVLLWVAMAFVFFAVTRFRLPIVATLIPWAGAALSLLREPGWLAKIAAPGRARLVSFAVGAVAFLVVVVPGIEADDTVLGIGRWGEQEPYRAGELLLRQGDAHGALEHYSRANHTIADTRYGLAAARLQTGDEEGALGVLLADEPEDRFEPDILRGEAARMAGDREAARASFNTRVVQVAGQQAVDWAWDHLRPPPAGRIELGSGLDLGYIRGFHGPERDSTGRTFRWMGPEGAVRGLTGNPELGLQVSGWRPGGASPAKVTAISSANRSGSAPVVQTLPTTDEWTTILVLAGEGVTLETNGFVPGGYDARLLGVRATTVIADRASIRTTDEANR